MQVVDTSHLDSVVIQSNHDFYILFFNYVSCLAFMEQEINQEHEPVNILRMINNQVYLLVSSTPSFPSKS